MDSLTHVYFADKLLKIVGGDSSASVASLFPQIDREPAYFHRMYGHPFFNIARLSEVGAEVYKKGEVPSEHAGVYEWERFMADRPRMLSFVQQFESETGNSISPLQADKVDVILGYVSHTYQDVFNNPMQAFLPKSVYPCGKWELWASLDHPIDFRTILYRPENIAEFRAEFFSDSLWDKAALDRQALIKAMVVRTAASSIVQLPKALIDDAVASLGVSEVASSAAKEAEDFLLDHEDLLERVTRKYASSRRLVGLSDPGEGATYPVGS